MRKPLRIIAACAALATVAALAACGSDDGEQAGGAGDVPTVAPATPAASPPPGGAITGSVIPAPAGTALAVAGTTVATLGTDGAVLLHTAPGAMDTPPPRTVDLGGHPATALAADGDGFLVATDDQVAHVARDGAVSRIAGGQGQVSALAAAPGERVLAGTADGRVVVLGRDGERRRDLHDFVRVDQLLVAPESSPLAGQVVVIDRAQSSVTPIDIDSGELKAALRAGNGVTQGTVDPYGRVLVSNTRDNEILGFYGQPIVMRFRFPVAQSPYALTYDAATNRLWVATTGDNVAIAYDLATGEPREKARIGTIGQITALATDPGNGMLYLLSGRGDGLQVASRTAVENR